MRVTERLFNVLFLCTGNSARSIFAEAILRANGRGRFNAYSAGSHPNGQINPLTLQILTANNLSTEGLRSKSWDEFAAPGAPEMDFVFTVCDAAAGETCPIWPGQPITAHWGIEDPVSFEGTNLQKEAAFQQAFRYMGNRVNAFLALPMQGLDKMALELKLKKIGQLEGHSAGHEAK